MAASHSALPVAGSPPDGDEPWNADIALAQSFAAKSTFLLDSDDTQKSLVLFAEKNAADIEQAEASLKDNFEHWFLRLLYADSVADPVRPI